MVQIAPGGIQGGPAVLLGPAGLFHQVGHQDLGPFDSLLDRPLFVQMGPDSMLVDGLELPTLGDDRLPDLLLSQVGKPQVIEHHLDQLFDVDLGLKIVHPRLFTGLAGPALALLGPLADGLALFLLAAANAAALPPPLTVNKAVAFHSPDRNPDHPPLVPGNYGLVADDVWQILANGLPDLVPVPGRVLLPPGREIIIGFGDGHVGYSSFLRISPTNWRSLSAQIGQ